jgi:hypothetical protein
MSSHNLTTIAVSRENRFRLYKLGKMHESYNDVLGRCLAIAEHGSKNKNVAGSGSKLVQGLDQTTATGADNTTVGAACRHVK